ncbi:MAG: FAD-binding protein [Proteobacteria bacterium]|nr:FAD-binding protein [Pseudomonadota bacterium]
MGNLESLGQVVKCDVLVIGGGVTGLWCAIKAKEHVDRVLIVDKGPQDWGGQGSMSGGAMVGVVPPNDSTEAFLKDFVYYYDGLCDQELMQVILSGSYDIIRELIRLGYQFITDDQGNLKGIPQRALDHVRCYIGTPFGMGGKNMVACLVQECERLGVERIGRIMVTDILKKGGQATGAVGFDTINGRFYIFEARSVILALGHSGFKISYHHNTCAGGSIDIGLRAGLEVSNLEFNRVWIMPRYFQWEGQTHLLPLGAKMVNAKGEVFMDKYSPIFGTNTDPHFVSRGMAIEALLGNGPFYMDCTGMLPESVEMVTPKGDEWMALNYHRLKDELGMDFFKDKLEWMAHQRWSVGGIEADAKGLTKIPGLFASGRARTTDPTVYVGGFSLCLCQVLGSITGRCAGEFAKSQEQLPLEESEIKALRGHLFEPVGREGIPPSEVLNEVRKAVFCQDVAILKNERSLLKALSKMEEIRNELVPRMAAKDPHYLMKCIEVQGIALVGELFLRASLMRKESRAGHFRADYPERDNENWLCWIIAHQEGDHIKLGKKPVPVEKYKIMPTKYYSDNFSYPKVMEFLA